MYARNGEIEKNFLARILVFKLFHKKGERKLADSNLVPHVPCK